VGEERGDGDQSYRSLHDLASCDLDLAGGGGDDAELGAGSDDGPERDRIGVDGGNGCGKRLAETRHRVCSEINRCKSSGVGSEQQRCRSGELVGAPGALSRGSDPTKGGDSVSSNASQSKVLQEVPRSGIKDLEIGTIEDGQFCTAFVVGSAGPRR
jgi:hypothetical protein